MKSKYLTPAQKRFLESKPLSREDSSQLLGRGVRYIELFPIDISDFKGNGEFFLLLIGFLSFSMIGITNS